MGAFIGAQTRGRLLETMRDCEQTSGMSVLRHGEMVADFFRDLVAHVRGGAELRHGWRLPDWIRDPLLWRDLPDLDLLAEYHLFHDCGKPQALVVGEDGTRRFPDHAAISRRVWIEAGGDVAIGDLIGMDMDVHLLKDKGVAEFSLRPQARALLLTALSEVHANASMFGGLESTSFKIKRKHVDKRGRAILKAIAAREALPMAA
jgi:hypothetical protein